MSDRYLLYPYQTGRIVPVHDPGSVRQRHCGLQNRNGAKHESGSGYHPPGSTQRKKEDRCGAPPPQRPRLSIYHASHGHFKLTRDYCITPSLSRRGNPHDNAMAENFFSVLKTECIAPQQRVDLYFIGKGGTMYLLPGAGKKSSARREGAPARAAVGLFGGTSGKSRTAVPAREKRARRQKRVKIE